MPSVGGIVTGQAGKLEVVRPALDNVRFVPKADSRSKNWPEFAARADGAPSTTMYYKTVTSLAREFPTS
jgi:hypothetical protein